jgi:hypothetical protein
MQDRILTLRDILTAIASPEVLAGLGMTVFLWWLI